MLQVDQVLRANLQLAIGNVNETVHVTAEVAPLNTENGAVKGDVIVQQEINDLPLDGRDFTDPFLVPGVVPMAQGGQGSGMNINGAWSTSPLADFLLGMMNQSTRTVGWNRNYLRSSSWGTSTMISSSRRSSL